MSDDTATVVDPAALDRLLRIGGHDFLLEMIDLFLDNAPQRLAAARTALAAGDDQALYRAAHSLKSTAGNLGVLHLKALAERVEERSRLGARVGLDGLLGQMESAFEAARERLEAERARRRGES